MVLPSGEESSYGVATVEVAALSLARFAAAGQANIVANARAMRACAEDIRLYCDPARHPASFRRCQSAAAKASRPLLLLARDAVATKELRIDTLTEVRVVALEALARICFGRSDLAAEVASADVFESTIVAALKPAVHVQQQCEHLAALQLTQGVAAEASEAPALVNVLPAVAALAAAGAASVGEGSEGRHTVFRAVRAAALEVLLSCALGRSRRMDVASVLPLVAAHAVLASAAEVNSGLGPFPAGLLFANLCDLPLPDDAAISFGVVAEPFWNERGFFDDLAACMDAALQREPWPPQSGIYHSPRKLARTCLRLGLAGYVVQLHCLVPGLIACVERRKPVDDAAFVTGADDAHAARLAAEALALLSKGRETLEAMRSSSSLRAALNAMSAEHPASRDLLELLAVDAGSACGAGDMLHLSARPF